MVDSSATAADPAFKAWFNENFPVWHAYLGGFGFDGHATPWGKQTKTYWGDPGTSDASAPLIFVRAGDEANPERWVQLRLWSAWMDGDRYFKKLIAYGGITMTDLLAMQVVLHEYKMGENEPPTIRTLPSATQTVLFQVDIRSRAVATATGAADGTGAPEHVGQASSHLLEDGSDHLFSGDWMPLPGDDHTGPAPRGTAGGTLSGVPGGQGPGEGHGGGVTEGIPNDGTGPNSHQGDPPATSDADQNRGVFWGDPAPVPFSDPGYRPRPGEVKVNFRCHGIIYNGYVDDCVDLMAIPATDKWDQRIGAFVSRNWIDFVRVASPGDPSGVEVPHEGRDWSNWGHPSFDSFAEWVFHHIWFSGSDPQCSNRCDSSGGLICGSGAAAMAYTCARFLGPICAAPEALTVLTFAGTKGFDECKEVVGGYCKENICGR